MDEASKACSACSRFKCILTFWVIAVLSLLAVEVVFRAFDVPDSWLRVFIVIWLIMLPVVGLFLWFRAWKDPNHSDGR